MQITSSQLLSRVFRFNGLLNQSAKSLDIQTWIIASIHVHVRNIPYAFTQPGSRDCNHRIPAVAFKLSSIHVISFKAARRRDPPDGVTVIVSIEIWFVTFALSCAIHVYAEGCSSGHNVLCGAARRVKLLQRSRWVCLWYQSFTSLPDFPLEWRKNQQYQHCQVKKSQHCQVKKSVYAKKKWYWGKNSIAGGG